MELFKSDVEDITSLNTTVELKERHRSTPITKTYRSKSNHNSRRIYSI